MVAINFLLSIVMLTVGLVEMSAVHPVHKRSVACFDKLGCFSNGPPFYSLQRPLTVVPKSPDDIRTDYLLYSRENRKIAAHLDARYVDTTLNDKWPNFEARPTKFVVHGFLDSPEGLTDWMKDMKDELLIFGDYNVILVDWSAGNLPPYTQATANTRVVGAQIALLIKQLMTTKGMSASDFHIIGHSLGAHIAGYAGERVPGLGRISGLDPAGPYFENTDKVVRLDPTDATFVDVIHSDAENLLHLGFGTKQQSGHVDFFPNLGHDQPGCSKDPVTKFLENGLLQGTEEVVACNHLRSYKMYVESINTPCPFMAFPCNNEDDFTNGRCQSCTGSGCSSMGFRADQKKPANGQLMKYYLSTADKEPFCQYHLEMTLKFRQTSVAREEKGTISVQIKGDNGATGNLNLSTMTFKPGETYHFTTGVASDVGHVRSVVLSWHHVSSLTDPLKWNLFGIRHPKIFLEEVDIYREEAGANVRLCTQGQGVETDHSLTIDTTC